ATKLKKAAHPTAGSGFRPRVETTVAIEFAASWKPLMKSNTSEPQGLHQRASGGRRGGRHREVVGTAPAHLQHDALDHIHHVLTAAGDLLESLVDLLPLDDLHGVGHLREEAGDQLLATAALTFTSPRARAPEVGVLIR